MAEKNNKLKEENEKLKAKIKAQQDIIGELTNHEHLKDYQDDNKQDAIDELQHEKWELCAEIDSINEKWATDNEKHKEFLGEARNQIVMCEAEIVKLKEENEKLTQKLAD
eukprot:COSAG04_NODE_834_length_9992_cov_54.919786_8_plen_110_part_00